MLVEDLVNAVGHLCKVVLAGSSRKPQLCEPRPGHRGGSPLAVLQSARRGGLVEDVAGLVEAVVAALVRAGPLAAKARAGVSR